MPTGVPTHTHVAHDMHEKQPKKRVFMRVLRKRQSEKERLHLGLFLAVGNPLTDGTNTTTYHYNLMGDKITYEERIGYGFCEIYYAYDNNGRLYGFYYDGSSNDGFYYYQRNIQGDIIALLDDTGDDVVTYTYDTWGKLVDMDYDTGYDTLGADNPFRYRGYYYDDETGLYYLNQRYYNPEWGRFINADDYTGQRSALLAHNLFAYCRNNPVVKLDSSGRDESYWSQMNQKEIEEEVYNAVKNSELGKDIGDISEWTFETKLIDDGVYETIMRHTVMMDDYANITTFSVIHGDRDSLYDYANKLNQDDQTAGWISGGILAAASFIPGIGLAAQATLASSAFGSAGCAAFADGSGKPYLDYLHNNPYKKYCYFVNYRKRMRLSKWGASGTHTNADGSGHSF